MLEFFSATLILRIKLILALVFVFLIAVIHYFFRLNEIFLIHKSYVNLSSTDTAHINNTMYVCVFTNFHQTLMVPLPI